MTTKLNIVLPLATLAVLAALAAIILPATVLSAPPWPGGARADKPATRPAPKGKKDIGRGGRSFGRLTSKQEEETLDYLKQRRPEIHKQMTELKTADPARYRRALWNIYSLIKQFRRQPKEVVEAHEQLHQSRLALWKLAREYNRAETPQRKEELEKAMRDQADKQFQADQIVRRHRLSELEAQIDRLKTELDRREKESETIIQETVEQVKRNAGRFYGARSKEGAKGREGGGKPGFRRPKKGGEKRDKPGTPE